MTENVSGKDELLEQSAQSQQDETAGAEDAPKADSDATESTTSENSAEDSVQTPASPDAQSEGTADDSDPNAEAAEPVADEPVAAAQQVEAGGSEDADATDAENSGDDSDDGDDVDEEDEFVGHAEPIELVQELVEDEEIEMNWFILKVASNRENSIADALRRRVKVEGLDRYFSQIIVPTEDVAEFKNGKKRITKHKLYPGYICVEMHVNDDTWFAVRDTPGIGDFTGAAGKPTPMLPDEVARILPKKPGEEDDDAEKVKSVIKFKISDRVRIKEGTFENFEGEVEGIDEANGRVTVVINIFDRPTPVEIDHWQLESV